jgi:hypothetical protein
MLRLRRGTAERASFLRVPAVAPEVFPTIPYEAVRDAIEALELPARERTAYAFTAQRE